MKCPKCGNDIKEGHLYCDKCGEEIRIVPDFDETSDENLKLSFSDVIDTAGVLEELSTVATKEISSEIDKEATKEINIKNKSNPNSSIDDSIEITDLNNTDLNNKPKPDNKILIRALVVAGAICVVIALIGITLNKKVNSYYSVDSQYEKAFEQYEEEKYEDSIKILKHALSIEPDDSRLKKLLADNYYMLKKYDESNAVLFELLDKYPDDPGIYDKIVANYEAQGDKNAINSFLAGTEQIEILNDYAEYIAQDVVFSVEEGKYDEIKYLELSTNDGATIYYTTDGNEADENSTVYSEPIELTPGEHEINAIAINEQGIKSENISKSYSIDYFQPEAPVIKTAAKGYNIPEPIKVEFSDFDLCYYTIDGEDPTREDNLYQGPVPMYIGEHTYKFAVITNKDVSSEVVSVKTTLDLITLVDMETSVNNLINWKKTKGSLDYSYECEQACYYNESVFYIINEYSNEEDGKKQTGNHYAVDVLTGMTYRAILNKSTGEYTLEALL